MKRKWARIILFFCISILVGCFNAFGQNSANQKDQEKNCKKLCELNKLKEQASVIANLIESPIAEQREEALNDRLKLIKNFEKWAKKYKVKLKQISNSESIKVENGNILPFKPCTTVMEKDDLICFANYSFFDHSSNTCIYRCVLKNDAQK